MDSNSILLLHFSCVYPGAETSANVKFQAEIPLEDSFYLSWIYPSGKLRKKGLKPIQVRVIEYTIEQKEKPEEQLTYRLITNLLYQFNVKLHKKVLLG